MSLRLILSCLVLSGCQLHAVRTAPAVAPPTVVISPAAIVLTGDKVVVSATEHAKLPERVGLSDAQIRSLGVVPGEFTDAQLQEVLSRLQDDSEQYFLSFYASIVAPANKSAQLTSNDNIARRMMAIIESEFLDSTEALLREFESDEAARKFREAFAAARSSLAGGKDPSVQALLVELDRAQKAAMRVTRAKAEMRSWLRNVASQPFAFAPSIGVTLDVAGRNKTPIIIARRVFASFSWPDNGSFGAKGGQVKFGLTQQERSCTSELNACRFTFTAAVGKQEPSPDLERFVAALSQQLARDKEGTFIEDMQVHLEMFVNGGTATEDVPGRF
ncbi:MAG TPA: hypothetical protein VI299_11280, partial [Polyangiales bacterium]